jgi:hypothetical protein
MPMLSGAPRRHPRVIAHDHEDRLIAARTDERDRDIECCGEAPVGSGDLEGPDARGKSERRRHDRCSVT